MKSATPFATPVIWILPSTAPALQMASTGTTVASGGGVPSVGMVTVFPMVSHPLESLTI